MPGTHKWGDAFPNKLLGAATLDRLRHGAYGLILDGESSARRDHYRSRKKHACRNGGLLTELYCKYVDDTISSSPRKRGPILTL